MRFIAACVTTLLQLMDFLAHNPRCAISVPRVTVVLERFSMAIRDLPLRFWAHDPCDEEIAFVLAW
jgi:hypothetical protein